jgi:hypothetical protein
MVDSVSLRVRILRNNGMPLYIWKNFFFNKLACQNFWEYDLSYPGKMDWWAFGVTEHKPKHTNAQKGIVPSLS